MDEGWNETCRMLADDRVKAVLVICGEGPPRSLAFVRERLRVETEGTLTIPQASLYITVRCLLLTGMLEMVGKERRSDGHKGKSAALYAVTKEGKAALARYRDLTAFLRSCES